MAMYEEYNYNTEVDPWAASSPRSGPTTNVTTAPADEPAKPDYSAWGAFRPEGLDETKVTSGHNSPKYQIARIQSHFDPTKGITPEMLDALNALGIGTFSGQNDRLTVSGNIDPAFEGVTGSDIVKGFKTGQGVWQGWGTGGTGPGVAPSAPVSTTSLAAAVTPNATPAPSAGAPDTSGLTILQNGGEGDPFAAMGGGIKLSNGGWIPKNHPLAIQLMSSSSSSGSTTTPGGTTSTGGTAEDGLPDDNKAALMQLLRQRMSQSLEIDPNDPIIRNQSEAFDAKAERARRNYLGDVAESSSPYGTGAMRGEERMTAEKMGQASAGFEAELMGRELTARRDEIRHALDSMGNLLTEGERQALQLELAKMDDALKRYSIATQDKQYYAGLGQADKHFYDELAQRDQFGEADDAFRWAQLGQNDSQFRDRLGFDYSDRQAYWDNVRRGGNG